MKNKTALCAIAFILSLVALLGGVTAYAWFAVSDRTGNMGFQIARINSEIYFYKASDSNFDGTPDLIGNETVTYPEEEAHPAYYSENMKFEFLSRAEAKAETEGQEFEKVAISGLTVNVVPSKIFTFKISLVNKGDTANDVTVKFGGGAVSAEEAKIRSVFAVRAVSVLNGGSAGELPSLLPGQWHYFCDGVSQSAGGYEFAETEPVLKEVLKGLDEQNAEGNDKVLNVKDYWIQIQMIPYEELASRDGFGGIIADKTEYQTLQGRDFSFDFSILFEVDVNI